jgi:hypothetical protein
LLCRRGILLLFARFDFGLIFRGKNFVLLQVFIGIHIPRRLLLCGFARLLLPSGFCHILRIGNGCGE